MAKLLFVCFLTFLAIQQSVASPVKTLETKDSWNVFQYIQFLSLKIEEGIKKVTTDLPEEIKNLSDKINIILSNYNLEATIIKVREEIKKLTESQSVYPCLNSAEDQVNKLVTDALQEEVSCEEKLQSMVNIVEEELNKAAESGRKLQELLINTVLKCKQESKSTLEICLRENIFTIVDDYQAFKTQIERALYKGKLLLNIAVEDFDKCVAKVQKKILQEEDVIINNFKRCVKM